VIERKARREYLRGDEEKLPSNQMIDGLWVDGFSPSTFHEVHKIKSKPIISQCVTSSLLARRR